MSKIVQKIINANAQKSGSAVVGIAGARALNASEFLDDKHTVDTQSIDQATSVIEASLKNRYDYINYYAGGFNVARHLFNKNEQGVWFNPSDMTAGKAGWRRNLLRYTEQFDVTSSGWNPSQSSVSANAATAPDGTSTADKLNANTNNSFHGLDSNFSATVISGLTYTLSIYAKASEYSFLRLGLMSSLFGSVSCYFDLANGTVGTRNGGVSAAISNAGSGWYRCSFTVTATSSGNANQSWIYVSQSDNQSGYVGSATSGIFIWGAQFEIASTPSEYQKITDFSTEFKQAFPLHTLYQDSNGVTPCTAAGDPVGLILDQSRGGLSQIGAELLTVEDDRTFGSDTGFWTKSTGVSITGGQCVFTAVASGNGVYRNSASLTTTGKWYQITFTVVSISAGYVRAYARNGINGPLVSTPGTYTHFVLCGSSDNLTGLFTSGASTTCVIDNISIKEIPGNHAYQTTSGQRPTLARIPSSGRRNLITYSEDLSNAAWNSLDVSSATRTNGNITLNSNEGFGYHRQDGGSFSTTTDHIVTVDITSDTTVANVPFRLAGTVSVTSLVNLTAGQLTRLTFTGYRPFASSFRIGIDQRDALVPGGANTTGYTVTFNRIQLETGSTATNYQKVTATTDVTESGFNDLWHLVFDGSDDSLVTNSVDFAGWTQETRRNLLINTENFSAWGTTNGPVVAANSVIAPDSTQNAAKVTLSSGVAQTLRFPTNISWQAGSTGTVSVWLKKASVGGSNKVVIMTSDPTTWNTGTDTVVTLTDTWTRYNLTGILSSTSLVRLDIGSLRASSATESGCDGEFHVWGAQLETGSLTDYQAPGTDEMTVIAGLRKLSDAAPGAYVELTSSPNVNNGTFTLLVPAGASATIGYYSKGTGQQGGDATISAPVTAVCSGLSDISSDVTQLRINGTLQINDTDDQGTGNYSNAAIYIGRRGGAAVPFNGHLYQLIVRGKTTSTDQIEQVEDFVKRKSGLSY